MLRCERLDHNKAVDPVIGHGPDIFISEAYPHEQDDNSLENSADFNV